MQITLTNQTSTRSSPMSALTLGATTVSSVTINFRTTPTTRIRHFRVSCVGWDPEGILGPPQTGHLARFEFRRRMEKDAEAREAFEQHVRQEKERRLALRQSRVIPDEPAELIEYFLDTEAQEIEFEISRLRPKLNQEFFSQVQLEIGKIRFAVSKTEEMEDRLIELEALQKALQEGTEAYDKMQNQLVAARQNLTKLLTSKDKKTTLLEMVEHNELNRPLLDLLDENIASANQSGQKEAADFMEKIRSAVVKYMTV